MSVFPSGWRDVSPCMGEPIAATNIIIGKAPIAHKPTSKSTFTPEDAIQQQKEQGRRVAFMVEVSVRPAAASASSSSSPLPHTRDDSDYYDPRVDLQPLCVKFVHFIVDLAPIQAAQTASTDPTLAPCPIQHETIKKFVALMRGLVAQTEIEEAKGKAGNTNEAATAASSSSSTPPPSLPSFLYLHDLYGFNLVGFLVACYLIEECGMDVMSAANDVADSRPPGIYISALFQALVNRYMPSELDSTGDAPPLPVIPDLPRPDFHQLPWTWNPAAAAPKSTPTSSANTGEAEQQANAEVPGETFKRKARKKPTPAAPVAIIADTPPPAAAAYSSSSVAPSSSSIPSLPSSVSGTKRALDGGFDDGAPKRPKVASNTINAPPANNTHVHAVDTNAILRDHPFLVPLQAGQCDKLTPVLTSLLPFADCAALKCGRDIWSLLRPPAITPPILQRIINAATTTTPPPPYSLSWMPRHTPCFMLLQRADVYIICGEKEWFHVPQMHFPKRKAPTENVNKSVSRSYSAACSGAGRIRRLFLRSVRVPSMCASCVLPFSSPFSTLLLGDLIVDPSPDGSFQSRYLATDLLVMSQTVLPKLMPLEQRLHTLDVELIQPLKQLTARTNRTPQLHIRCKMFFPCAKVESVWHMSVGHGNLGLVWQFNRPTNETNRNANEGYKLVCRKEDMQGVEYAQIVKLAQTK